MGKRGFLQTCRSRTCALGLLAALAGASVPWACDDDGGTKVRIVVDSEVPAAGAFDTVEVTVTASETDEGRLCRPLSQSFGVEGDGDLPLVVYYLVGPTYRRWIAVRALWKAGDIPVYLREIVRPITGDTYQQIDLVFETDCEDVSCEDGQQCISGLCQELYRPDLFIFDPAVMDDVPCDR
jgi:hypothetical protein